MASDLPGNVPRLLFCYGTLGPGGRPGSGLLGWRADAVRGRIYDTGPYPILVGWDDPEAPWAEGHVRPVDQAELEGRLDSYEGVGEGLFSRVALRTRSGLLAWTYVYPHPVPAGAAGPIVRWDGPRVDPGPG